MATPRKFTDFEDYCESIVHADLRMRVLGMEFARYSIIQATVGRLGIQWAQEGSGQLSEGATDRSKFGVYLQLNSQPRLVNGMPLDPDAILVLPPGSEFCFSCDHANSWLAISIPQELLADCDLGGGRELIDTVDVVRPPRAVTANLRRLVLEHFQLLQHTPLVTHSVSVNAAVEGQILAIVADVCFKSDHFQRQSNGKLTDHEHRHGQIAKDAAQIIHESLDDPMMVAAKSDTALHNAIAMEMKCKCNALLGVRRSEFPNVLLLQRKSNAFL